jgi:hypothetical protein
VKVKAITEARWSPNGFDLATCPKGEVRDLEPSLAEKFIKLGMFEKVEEPKKETKPKETAKKQTKPATPKKEVKVEEQSNDSASD